MILWKKKWMILLAVLLVPIISLAQFTEVHIGVNGLTCSQCTRNVEMQIRKLDFVQDVKMNLEHTDGKIFFNPEKKIQVEKIAEAVRDAGFSVRFLKTEILFSSMHKRSETCYELDGNIYQFVSKPDAAKEKIWLQFIGQNYLPKNELKKWKNNLKPSCDAEGKIYYVQPVSS